MTSPRFISLKKSDPQFEAYLWGREQDRLKPIPIETFNLGSSEETVTFELVDVNSLKKPSFFTFVSNLVKLPTFILILMPLLFIIIKNFVRGGFNDPFALALSALGMLFLYAGLNIRNDVNDHLSGFDRVNISFSPKPILKGWIAAYTASKISWVLIGLSLLISIPAFILQSELIRVFFVVLVLFLTSEFLQKNSYKHNWPGEITLFLLIGPALTAGYQVALGGGIDTESLAFGVLWGVAALFLIHVNNFSHILTSSQAKIKNTMTNMGFDKAKKFLVGWWILFFVLWFTFHWFYAGAMWVWGGTAILILGSIPLFLKLKKADSPVGSALLAVRRTSLKTFLFMVFLLVIENFGYLGVKIIWSI